MKNRLNRLYHLETFILMGLFILVTLVLSRVFISGRLLSQKAQQLTDAVCLAENTAELVRASDSKEDLAVLLDIGGNAETLTGTQDGSVTVRMSYDRDMKPSPQAYYTVDARIGDSGERKDEHDVAVRVYDPDGEEIYVLELTVSWQEVHHE